MRLPAALQVFVGGAVGGALRIGIDQVVPTGAYGIPWDIVAINVVGSFALGLLAARSDDRGGNPHFPLLGPGLLGGFTTFSAITALHWTAETPVGFAAVVLVANLALAVGAAAWGWALGSGRRRALASPGDRTPAADVEAP